MTDRRVPGLVRGSLITLRRRCGKPTCRCADGAPHETPALSYSFQGRTRTVTLRAEDLPAVHAALERYATARQRLEDEALAGIEALRARVGHPER
ncbi:MAG: hypothetical protein IT196_17940 [Acidimicrobiales bacterium]|nr:hypothetical protein [Acidimicrobiales bacterium]